MWLDDTIIAVSAQVFGVGVGLNEWGYSAMASEYDREVPRFLPYVVRGRSMTPALRPGDYLLVRTAATATHPPARSDVVVVAAPAQSEGERLKRIVGMPGERIAFAHGILFVDGSRVVERYLGGLPSHVGLDELEFILGEDEYFVMGDNRAHSTDSRHYGPVHRSQIQGRAVCRIWPPYRWGML